MEERKAKYNNKGMYSGYDKNHSERNKDDFYATPPAEVTNILKLMNLSFGNSTILDPCAGTGHLVKGIQDYLAETGGESDAIFATDIKKREPIPGVEISMGKEYDFLEDGYIDCLGDNNIDYIIMNPPFKILEPFLMKSLGIANKGVLMFARLQFLEGQSRYENILKDNPPNKAWVYVDRISCAKDGDFSVATASVQAYAWFYWDLTNEPCSSTELSWIRKVGK